MVDDLNGGGGAAPENEEGGIKWRDGGCNLVSRVKVFIAMDFKWE